MYVKTDTVMSQSNALLEDYSKACQRAALDSGTEFVELYSSMMKEKVDFVFITSYINTNCGNRASQ